MIRIPFSLLPTPVLKRLAHKIEGISYKLSKNFKFLHKDLHNAQIGFDAKEYMGACLIASFSLFLFFSFMITFTLILVGQYDLIVSGFIASFLFADFAFFQQLLYPKLVIRRRVRDIERNLIGALQNLLIQINSGVPLFDVLVNISGSNYGGVSKEFGKAVREILSGEDEVEVLERVALQNPSKFFRRAIWQIVNGMKAGSDISNVISEVIISLGEEQLIQIQRFGSQLNPLAMFYMLIAVIVPSLGLTFVIILSTFISLGEGATKLIFFGLLIGTVFLQFMFVGVIKARRPNLLGE